MSEPERTGSRFVDICVTLLFGAMALYGTVLILQAIWIWLCLGAAVAGICACLWWFFRTRF